MRRSILLFALFCSLILATEAQELAPAGSPATTPLRGATDDPPRPRVAVVLSGGSALGIAHVGVLRVIEEAGIPVDMILGTSMGAVVGGLYAAGYSPAELERLVTGLDWSLVFSERRGSPGDRYDLLKRERFPLRIGFDSQGIKLGAGLLDGQNVLALFTELTLHALPVRDFDRLPVPYRAVAADLVTGEKVVLSSGSLAEAMRASMSIPGVFRPYELDGRRLVDGGIVDNLPVDVARTMGADIVIAVECRAGSPRRGDALDSGLAVTAQTFNLFVQQNMAPSRKEANLLIAPDLAPYGIASYGDAAELVKLGEAGARAALPRLRELAKEIAATRSLPSPEGQANRRTFRALPLLTDLRVEGGTPSDRQLARRSFDAAIGRQADRPALRRAIDSLYATGRFDFVKLDLLPAGAEEEGRAVALVRLVPDLTPDDALLFSLELRSLFTSISENEAEARAGLLLRDLTGKDSALFIEGGLLDDQRAYAEYFQPFGPFFLMPFFRYEAELDAYYLDLADVWHTLYKSTGGGGWAGVILGKHADLKVGYSLESVVDYGYGDPQATHGVAALQAAFRFDDRPTCVFPERGFAASARARWAAPALGGDEAFSSVEARLDAALPLAKRLTLALAGYAASDLSEPLPESGLLPPERYFSIRQPGLFYGLAPWPATGVGNQLAALALELRYKLGSLSPLFGGELFALANLSGAAVRQWPLAAEDPVDLLPLRWDGSLGLGLRLSDHLGLLLALGYLSDGDAALGPERLALSIELGSFSRFLDEGR